MNNNRNNGGDGGNTTTLNLTENTTVGLINNTLSSELLVYPNPASNMINLKTTASDATPVVAQLYTVSGQLVFSENLSLQQNTAKSLNVSSFKNGYYLLRISTDGQTVDEKILIQH